MPTSSKNLNIPKVAVLTFPGNNCEIETQRALLAAGFDAEIFLWNRNENELENFDGVVIPGGFSFEDRGRSGIVAAQEGVLKKLKHLAENGLPVLGICNGAQIVVESGLLLNDQNGISAVALARNERKNADGEILGTGFYHSHRTLKVEHQHTPFSHFDGTMKMPIAHGEGRFVVAEELLEYAKKLVVFSYVDENGEKNSHYPTNPNGSFENAAAICSPKGNVVACMPHPERSFDGKKVFESFFAFCQNAKNSENSEKSEKSWKLLEEKNPDFAFPKREKNPTKKSDISFFVRLKITDNTEKTFENVLKKTHQTKNENFSLIRREKWSFQLAENVSAQERKTFAEKIISSLILLNPHKESVLVQIENQLFSYISSEKMLVVDENTKISENSFCVHEKKDFRGESKKSEISHLFPEMQMASVESGVFWEFEGISSEEFLQNPLFAGFVAEEIR